MEIKANDFKPREVVKILREWTEMTQNEFADSIHLSRKTIEGYEYGQRNVSFATLLKICKAHDMEIIIRKKQ